MTTIARLIQEIKLCCEEGRLAANTLGDIEAVLVESLDVATDILVQAVEASDMAAVKTANDAIKLISDNLKAFTRFDKESKYQGLLIHNGVDHQLTLAE